MVASGFLLLVLAIGLSQAETDSQSSLPSINPWAKGGRTSWFWPLLRYWLLMLQKSVADNKESIYQDEGDDHFGFAAPRATAGAVHGARFSDEYGFPRYGGESPVSRYGIDYGDRHVRRHLFGGDYNYRPVARSFGVPRYVAFRGGRSYPRLTHQFSGQEHPTNFDPYLANPYYRNPFHAQRFVAQNPYFRI